jgi:hypothetical protein
MFEAREAAEIIKFIENCYEWYKKDIRKREVLILIDYEVQLHKPETI